MRVYLDRLWLYVLRSVDCRYIYRSELDIRLEYTLLAAALFKVYTSGCCIVEPGRACKSILDFTTHLHTLTPSLLQSVLSFSLPYPLSDLDYATFPHQLTSSAESSQRLLPGLELFSDPHRCDPPSLLSSLHCCSQELVTRNHPVKVQTLRSSLSQTAIYTIGKKENGGRGLGRDGGRGSVGEILVWHSEPGNETHCKFLSPF